MPFPLTQLAMPLIAAPMFLVSGPDLVIAACRSGVIGAFPALNQRSSDGYEAWLEKIADGLTAGPLPGAGAVAPYAVNLIVHATNKRLQKDLELTIKHRVPLVITSLGAVREVVQAVQEYGGLVLHDVTTVRHGEKALGAGVDGLIAVAAGAGGHGGTLNPFALLGELRRLTSGIIGLAGSVSHGRHLAAALALGADFAYAGTRFIATQESLAAPGYKAMLLQASAKDIVYTSKISGIPANFIVQSLQRNGIDPGAPNDHGRIDLGEELNHEGKAWKDVWSAGHGVGMIDSIPSTADLCARLRAEYRESIEKLRARIAA